MKLVFPDQALEEHVGILGKVGSGKTYTAKGIAEYLLSKGRRLAVIDPTGVWYGLKSHFPVVVFGGDHADIPITEFHGRRIGEMIAKELIPVIVDVSGLLLSQQRRFMTEFAEGVFQDNRTALHLIIDEADSFIPQKPQPDQTMMVNRMDRLVRRGRARGFRVTLITQRPAVLNKDSLSQVGTLIAMKLTSPQDRKAIEGWVEGQADRKKGREIIDSLPTLKRGEGWVWAPGHDMLKRVTFPKIKTFDSSRTPGEGGATDVPPKLIDLPAAVAKLKERLGDGAAPGATKRAASAGPAPAVRIVTQGMTKEQIGMIEAHAHERGRRKGYKHGGDVATDAAITKINTLRARLIELVNETSAQIRAENARPISWPEDNAPHGLPISAVATIKTRSIRRALASTDDVKTRHGVPLSAEGEGGGEMRLLRVLAARHPNRLTKTQWATLSGVKPTGSTFRTYVSRLRTRGMIDGSDAGFGLTATGFDATGGTVTKPNMTDVLNQWRAAVGSGCFSILDYLLSSYPRARSRHEIAAQLDMQENGSTLRTYISRLKSNGLIEIEHGEIKAADVLFLDGKMAA